MKTRILPLILLALFSAGALEAAPVVDKWQWRNPLPQGHDLKALAYGNGLYVAVGDYGTILSSADGVEWAVHSLETPVSINGVAYGNGTFVAVGHRHPAPPTFSFGLDVVLTSVDGRNWTERATGANGEVNFLWNVAYGNGLFVAVGSTAPYLWPITDFILTSPDGVTWTARTAGTNSGISKVSFGGGRFVVVGNSDVIQTSVNGIDWSWKPFATGGIIQNITYGAGSWFAVGYAWNVSGYMPFITSSPDAVNWTVRYAGLNPATTWSPLLAVAYGNGRFVAMGMEFVTGEGNLTLVSADGQTWDRTPDLRMLERPAALLHAAGQFVAVGEHGNIATSPDGSTWTARSRATSNNLRGIAYGDGKFVAVGNNGTNLTSPNGLFWTGHKTGTGGNLREVTFAASQFVAVGGNGTIVTSPNGADWFVQDSGTLEDLWDVTYGNGTFVSVGGNSGGDGNHLQRFAILTSSDGANWTTRLANPNFNISFELHAVAYGNGRFVAVGRPAAILTSFNGINWVTNRNEPEFGTYLKGITYGNGLFVAVGETSNAWTSPDGSTWTLRPLPVLPSTEFDDVGYGDGVFVAVGDGGIILTSVNGIDWSVPHSRTSTNLRDVTYGAGTFVIVGNNDHILQSGTNTTPPAFGILAHPRSQLVSPGASVTFDVLVQASVPLDYQWQRNGANIPGATGPSLALSNVQVDDSAYFSVIVNDGEQTLTSEQAFLLVTPADPLDSWTLPRGTVPAQLLGVAHGAERFVAVGNTLALTSRDGLAWTTNAVPGTNLQDVTFGNGLFVACGGGGGIAISSDGTSWTAQSSGTLLPMNAVTYGDGRFVAVGGFGPDVTTSLDGKTWTPASLPTNSLLRDVTYGNGQFVAVGESGRVLTSANGISWISRNSGTNAPLYGVAYGNGKFVAVGPLRLVLTSPDGVAWTVRTNPASPAAFLSAVTYGPSQFIALGVDGTTLSSADGVNWRAHPAPFPALALRNIAVGPSVVAVGSQIIRSSPLVPVSPEIVVQPQSKAPLVGTSHTLNVIAVGTPPPRYQWRRNDMELPGATNSNYTIASIQLTNEGTYSVVVSSPFGSVTSAPAEVVAGVSAAFVQQPLSQDVVAGGSVTLSAVVTGRPPAFTYVWRYEGTSLRVTNMSSESLTFHTYVAPSILATQRFRVTVSNAASIGPGASSGFATVRVLADSDGDGLPDLWENDFMSAGDAMNDSDHDGLSNGAEYLAGTDPTDAASVLRLEVAQTAGSSARLRFTAVSNKTYTVLVKPALDSSPWQRLADVAATATSRPVEIQHPFGAGNVNRFYRLVTPRTP